MKTRLLGCGLITFLTACATTDTTTPAPTCHQLPSGQTLDAFTNQGVLEVSRSDQKRRFRYLWSHQKQQDRLDLYGPLGITLLSATRTDQGVSIEQSQGTQELLKLDPNKQSSRYQRFTTNMQTAMQRLTDRINQPNAWNSSTLGDIQVTDTTCQQGYRLPETIQIELKSNEMVSLSRMKWAHLALSNQLTNTNKTPKMAK